MLFRTCVVSCCLLVGAVSAKATPYAPIALSAASASADVALMRRALETVHPGLYRYQAKGDIDAAFARLEATAARETTDLTLWRAIALMLAEIHCDHTKTEGSVAIERFRATQATHLPLRFKLVEGRMMVLSNDGQAGAPPAGAEIVGINGRPAPVVLATLGHAVAYDGSTDQAIAAKLAADSDLTGDDFNEYWPAFFGFPAQWDLAWKRASDLQLTHSTLAPVRFADWTRLAWPGGSNRDEFYQGIRWRLGDKAAYLRIDTFVNYRNPVDATAFLGGFFRQMKAQHTTDLVLDLRANSGGSEDVSVALGRYLLRERFTWSKPVRLKAVRYGDLTRYIESWGDRDALFEPPLGDFHRLAEGGWERIPRAGRDDDESALPQDVSPDRFTGRVTVLTSPANGSGATRTIAQLQEKIGARLVGEESAGSAEGPTAGYIFLLTLPNSGIRVRIPNAWNRTAIERFAPGRGVAVDETVVETVADVLAGRDRVLEVARETATSLRPSLNEVFAGNWRGTLEYRDFGNDRRAILPTLLSAKPSGASTQLDFSFDDGPGKTVLSSQTWAIDPDGRTLTVGEGSDNERLTVVEHRGKDLGHDATLVAEGRGQENDHPVDVRLVLARRGDQLTMSRLTRLAGEPFLLRHVYQLSRGS